MCQRPQPAKIVLAAMGASNREVARRMGKTPAYLGRVLNGHVRASEQFRADLATILGLPVDQLFDDTPCTCRAQPSQEQLGSLLRAVTDAG